MSNLKLKLKVVTPENLVLEEEVERVTVPTIEGEVTVLPRHIPLVVALKSGDLVAHSGNEVIPFAIAGGFLEVKKADGGQTHVVVLADFAEHVSNLTEDAIAEAKARAEELKHQMMNKDHVDFEHFESELERSLTRVKIADKWRTKKYRNI